MARRRIGVWFIGAKGGVATTATVGLLALRKGWAGTEGLVSELNAFRDLDLVGFDKLVIGGHDIRQTSLYDEARQLHEVSHVLDYRLVERCKPDLQRIDKRIRPGVLFNVGKTIESLAAPQLRQRETPRQAIERVQEDLQSFIQAQKLAQLIVMNVASTEPPLDAGQLPTEWKELNKLLDKPRKCPLPASSLYAIAALDLGLPYINFTPSLGSGLAALDELARARETCHMGHDGKTGETLVKSALAPMFASRNLEIMSWVGHNIFGNMDGQVLDDPVNKQSKVTSKDRLLGQILGYEPQTHVGIEYIRSLGDWKTAWDHVHFRGFLGTPMIMQFVWQGCDSLLAAPLVLDLVRFTERAHRFGDRGLLTFLASFFKSPLGVDENDFVRQFQLLQQWADRVRAASTSSHSG